eukprot:c25454_g1_i2 orf=85-795(+)
MAGPQCCIPAPPSQYSATGKEELFGHLASYVVECPSSKAAVILVSDVFGFGPPNLRKLADKIAIAGYLVVVPDLLNNEPFNPSVTSVSEWRKKHSPAEAVEDVKKVIEVLKGKGITSIGAAGMCWGAKVVVELAKEDDLKAAVLCHPSLVTVEDIKVVKTPIAILAAEIDKTSPPELIEEFSRILDSREEVESFVNIYPGVAHGWTVRYDVDDEEAVRRAEEAHGKMLEWFRKHLS